MPGFAFQYLDGKALPKPLLAGRKARVVITSDTPTFSSNGSTEMAG
jgi:putative NADPH-quinone reductase